MNRINTHITGLLLAGLLLGAICLSGCGIVKGAGEDVSAIGNFISNGAASANPSKKY